MSELSQITTYRPGQGVICRIESIEPGGYGAVVVAGKLPPPSEGQLAEPPMKAFVPSTEPLEIGQNVPATFVCMHNNRALMTFAFMLGTTETIQLSTASDKENAFAIWVDSYPSNQRVRRAIDLFMPAVEGKLLHELKCANCDSKKLLADLELAHFTGCIKARSEEKKSRSALLIINGRVVGAIYGKKDAQETYPVDKAIKMMGIDLLEPETLLTVYELPEGVVLSMAALFLGCPIAKDANKSTADYLDHALVSMKLAGETGCVTISQDSELVTTILFVYQGSLVGVYNIPAQSFSEESAPVVQETKEKNNATIEAHILPVHLLSDAITFGYKLSGAFA
ncbi:MAG: hypothetical protein JSS83_02745 [Cyanobacteria bacterium SZAS LIN-3]|nr:hypothetical protein [Cyanobacteria bacterium SZAS LIN-3]